VITLAPQRTAFALLARRFGLRDAFTLQRTMMGRVIRKSPSCFQLHRSEPPPTEETSLAIATLELLVLEAFEVLQHVPLRVAIVRAL
jgi:hypothetical protein